MDPHYAGLLHDFYQAIDDLDHLSPRLSSLCSIAAASAFESEAQLEEFLRAADGIRVSPQEALEAIFYSASFAGFRALSRGLRVFTDVFGVDTVKGETKADYPDGDKVDGYDGPGLDIGIQMYGAIRARANIDAFRAVDRKFADALERYAYSGLFRRHVLTPLEREIASVALLSALEKPGPFIWHSKAALRLGATPDQLKYAVLKQIPISGVLRAFAALRSLSEVVTDWRAHPNSDSI
jgi:alkylhydroperoxidase/carboxymuconolactone decarboxylase family protein YurZ